MKTHTLHLERQAKPTLTPVELDSGDTLSFTLHDGRVNSIRVESTSAEVLERNYAAYHYGAKHGDISAYAFTAVLEVNGNSHCLRREGSAVATAAAAGGLLELDGSTLTVETPARKAS